jgi:DNA polymerase-3 subunit beta
MNVRDAIALAAHVAEARASLPILAAVRIHNGAVTATDTTQQIELPVQLPKALQQASFCVQAARLTRVLKALPADQELDLRIQGRQLILTAGPTRFELNTLPAEDFPMLNPQRDAETVLTVESKKFIAALQFARPAMPQADIRFYLNGLHLAVGPAGLQVTATDGHRLHRTRVEIATDGARAPLEAILACASVPRVLELAARHDEVTLALSKSCFIMGDGEAETLSSKCIDGSYPDASRVIPSERHASAGVERQAFVAALKRVAQINAGEKANGLLLDFYVDHIGIEARNVENERATERFDCGEHVNVHLGRDANDALYLTDDGDGSQQVVIMPMRP